MGTLKKFWKYFLLFIVMFVIIGGLTSLAMRENFKEIANYKIIGTSPIITVTESEATNTHGYIKGTVTNNKETINFNINYRYNNVDKIVVGLTDEKTKDEIYNFFSDIEDDELAIALPIAGLLVLYTVLP